MEVFDIKKVLTSLSFHKPIFLSENDLQSAFADEVRKLYPQAKVEKEIRYNSVAGYSRKTTRIDVLISLENDIYLVELKYKTKLLAVNVNNISYSLGNDRANDDNRYNFLHDVNKLEDYIVNEYNGHVIKEAYAVFITNDLGYQNEKKENSVSRNFDISNNKTKTGVLRNMNELRNQTVFLVGEYLTNWSEYSRVTAERNNIFWISIFKVNKSNFK